MTITHKILMKSKDYELIVERGASFSTSETTSEMVAESCEGARKLGSTDWESKLSGSNTSYNIFEVRFKNTRKGYYQNVNNLSLKVGDIVAVESSPGHDIGIISLTGNMVRKHMRCKRFNPEGIEFKKIYRLAKGTDITKWQEAIALEHDTMIRSRRIAEHLGLNMKIGDVEYQGDKVKAIFYYIADARVDFRELIRVFADEFKVRIEMKQIGARQEAGRIGGIGSCGRQLCCSTWVTNFVSVTTNSARFQEISLNPQKLAGQCGKLKCCLNYEVDSYIDVRKTFPKIHAPLETLDAQYFLVKSDILKGEMSFSSDPRSMVNVVSIPISRVREVMSLNRKGVKVDKLKEVADIVDVAPDYMNVVGDDSITRFDKNDESRRRNNRNRNKKKPRTDENKNNSNGETKEQQPKERQAQPRREKGERQQQQPKSERADQKPVNKAPKEGAKKEVVKKDIAPKEVDKSQSQPQQQETNGDKPRPKRRYNNRRNNNRGGNPNNKNNNGGGSAE